ncbi:hypothetical protein ACFQZ1_07875 [Bacillus sp. CGMCC 1.60114]
MKKLSIVVLSIMSAFTFILGTGTVDQSSQVKEPVQYMSVEPGGH